MSEVRTLDDTLPVQGQGRTGTAWWGLMCVIGTEGILFAYLIFSYGYLASQNVRWLHDGPRSLRLALPATVLLVGSSIVLEWAKRVGNRGRTGAARLGVVLAVLMGAAFMLLELREWKEQPFAFDTDSYSSIYFLLTGTHLAHVAVGLLGLLMMLAWSFGGRLRTEHSQYRALTTLYWHFVDAVWLFVFATIYLSPRLA
ncbi:cytochrome c oxidase subunit 3 [Cognatilysobacter lacus]|uniref:cytochrome-c oxidase n=1 Tax=Cognatilysobacter lacus TaxID=1643323 RepID=A0A5D8Z838_9GAMM|nr:cytochrome c oxidase subunit 3 [Lysobacter lacus]TZF90800.1 heme-copper oxidase subunit III [Lysobacter lacus]